MKKFNHSLFIFRRDVRLADNRGLHAACDQSEKVTVCFIVDPRQIKNNPYRSEHAVQFMYESLIDLSEQVAHAGGKLHFIAAQTDYAVKQLIKECALDAVFVSRDYTPFSAERDEGINNICEQFGVQFEQVDDCLLNAPEVVLKPDGKPYSIFGFYFKKAVMLPVAQPIAKKITFAGHAKLSHEFPISDLAAQLKMTPSKTLAVHGGSKQAHIIMRQLSAWQEYETLRNFPEQDTLKLSAHLKFGTLSVRELYHHIAEKLGKGHGLIRSLYWRDFFTQIAFHFPNVFGHAFIKKFDHLPFQNDSEKFKQWCNGTTGFPIVDAGMRELNQTGFMHNRVRMIVASVLIKTLRIDWRWGEKYFAQKLVDYDPAVNNGNWQWSASTGCDAQPYFRIFNPWLQQKKFDPECAYIKRWVTELKMVEPKEIHRIKSQIRTNSGYPDPLVEHAHEAALTRQLFEALAK